MKPDNGIQKRMIVMILKCHVKGFENDCANLFIHSNSIVRNFYVVMKVNVVISEIQFTCQSINYQNL